MKGHAGRALAAACLAAVVAAGCGGTDDAGGETSGGDVNPLMNPNDPAVNQTAPDNFRVRLATSAGDVVLELHREWAPNGVDRFYNLVRNGFYDGARFFRVLDGFVAQFGMSPDPRIQAIWRNRTLQDDPVVEGNTRGRVTFAQTQMPDSRSTQLFINYADNTQLDGMGFAAIGEVVEGMEVVDRLYSGYGETPRQDLIASRGNEYLTTEFPELDYIESAEVLDGA